MKEARFSLFFLKKKAFKSFLKESKQDLYSSKNLLDKAFSFNIDEKEKINENYFNYSYSHVTFCSNPNKLKLFFCIHCGMVVNFF